MRWSERRTVVRSTSEMISTSHSEQRALSPAVAHLVLVRPMQRIALFAALFLAISTPLLLGRTEIVIHRADITAVDVSGASVAVSVFRPSSMDAPDAWRDLSIRFAFTVAAAAKDMYISNAALKAEVFTVTFRFPDPASAAQFAISLSRDDHE
jgi:hypothetical protein